MKGRAPTRLEKQLYDRMAQEIGCIVCYIIHGPHDPGPISIHHIDGRTKPQANSLVLPLCAGHHQQGTGEDKTLVAVHPRTRFFEGLYGTQNELLVMCLELLGWVAADIRIWIEGNDCVES